MKRFLILTKLEVKKSIKAVIKMLAGTCLMFLVAVGISMIATNMLSGSNMENAAKIGIAVVSDEESKLFDMAFGILESTESVSDNINLLRLSKKEAKRMLESGEVMAIMYIPKDVIQGIISGENTPISIEFDENAGYEAAIFKELADSAANMLSCSQASIYSVYDFYKEYRHKREIEDALDRLNKSYIATILMRDSAFEREKVYVTGELGVSEYYVISGIVLFLFLFGINQVAFIEPYKKEVEVMLAQNECSILKQVIAKIVGMMSVYMCIALVIAILFLVYTGSVTRFFCVFGIMLLLGLLTNSMVMFLQTLSGSRQAAVMSVFFVTIIQGFITGSFVPSLMLPDAVNNLAKFMPAHYMIEEMKIYYLNESGFMGNTMVIAGMSILFISLSAFVKKIRNGERL